MRKYILYKSQLSVSQTFKGQENSFDIEKVRERIAYGVYLLEIEKINCGCFMD